MDGGWLKGPGMDPTPVKLQGSTQAHGFGGGAQPHYCIGKEGKEGGREGGRQAVFENKAK